MDTLRTSKWEMMGREGRVRVGEGEVRNLALPHAYRYPWISLQLLKVLKECRAECLVTKLITENNESVIITKKKTKKQKNNNTRTRNEKEGEER